MQLTDDTRAKLIQIGANIIHLDECARAAVGKGNSHAALIYYDRMSAQLGRMFKHIPDELQQALNDASSGASEGKGLGL